MLLKELFDNNINQDTPETLVDDVKFFIDHDDDLHKEYFLPVADEMKRKKLFDVDGCYEMFMPMVDEACGKYHEQYKIPGQFEELYTKDLKEKICRRIAEDSIEEIKNGTYDPKEA